MNYLDALPENATPDEILDAVVRTMLTHLFGFVVFVGLFGVAALLCLAWIPLRAIALTIEGIEEVRR